jgi:deoxyadenosine/deoxycytidine kinase
MESNISEPYLRGLVETYSRFFYHYDAAPLMIVNTERLNPIERDEDFAMLLRQIVELRGRRSFFNLAD